MSNNPKLLTEEHQISDLLSQMTLEEKVHMVHGESTFRSGGCERLGIPSLVMSDGPHGVRREVGHNWAHLDVENDAVSYLPVGVALAATWNVERAADFGDVLGSEARARGKDVILGPGINIHRSPLCGRNLNIIAKTHVS